MAVAKWQTGKTAGRAPSAKPWSGCGVILGRLPRTRSPAMDVPSTSQPAVRTVEIAPPSARAETWNVLRAAVLIVLATWIYIADTAAPGASGAGGGAAGWPGEAGAPGQAGAGGRGGPGGRDGDDARDLMPYQRLFRSLGGDDQRLFRELQEGLLEAENVRSSTRRWPAPTALAARGIPPFADAAGRGGRRLYRWQLLQEGPIVNYLGMPADRRDPAFLLLVQEPDPGAPAEGSLPRAPAGGRAAQGARQIADVAGAAGTAAAAGAQATDEVHHRLADGTLLHVSVWLRGAAAAGGASAAGGAGAAGPGVPADDPGRDPRAIAVPYARGWTQVLVGATRQ